MPPRSDRDAELDAQSGPELEPVVEGEPTPEPETATVVVAPAGRRPRSGPPDAWFVGSPEGYLEVLPTGPSRLGWEIATSQLRAASSAAARPPRHAKHHLELAAGTGQIGCTGGSGRARLTSPPIPDHTCQLASTRRAEWSGGSASALLWTARETHPKCPRDSQCDPGSKGIGCHRACIVALGRTTARPKTSGERATPSLTFDRGRVTMQAAVARYRHAVEDCVNDEPAGAHRPPPRNA